jgi:hypothetical protein
VFAGLYLSGPNQFWSPYVAQVDFNKRTLVMSTVFGYTDGYEKCVRPRWASPCAGRS